MYRFIQDKQTIMIIAAATAIGLIFINWYWGKIYSKIYHYGSLCRATVLSRNKANSTRRFYDSMYTLKVELTVNSERRTCIVLGEFDIPPADIGEELDVLYLEKYPKHVVFSEPSFEGKYKKGLITTSIFCFVLVFGLYIFI